MGIFKGEQYSREAYDAAKKHADAKYETARYVGSGRTQATYDALWEASALAKERLQRLYAKGEKEAHALNEEYDQLRSRVQEAVQALRDFERDKLDMHQGAEQEQSSETPS